MFSCTIHGIKIELLVPNENQDGSSSNLRSSAAHENGIICGGWEQCERDRINRFLTDTDVIEFGGGTGFIACFTAKKMKPDKRLVVFEANPLLIPVIEHNRDINGLKFEVINKAYGVSGQTLDFKVWRPYDSIVAPVGSSLEHPTVFKVNAISLNDVIKDYNIESFFLSMDVEGAEINLVNDTEALNKCKGVVMDIHSPKSEAGYQGFEWIDIHSFLLGQGFKLLDRCGCVNWAGAYGR